MPRIHNIPSLPSNHADPIAPVVTGTTGVARMCGVDSATIRHARIAGELWGKPFPPFFRAGKRNCMYYVADVHAFLAKFDLHATTATEDVKPLNPFAKKS